MRSSDELAGVSDAHNLSTIVHADGIPVLSRAEVRKHEGRAAGLPAARPIRAGPVRAPSGASAGHPRPALRSAADGTEGLHDLLEDRETRLLLVGQERRQARLELVVRGLDLQVCLLYTSDAADE